MFMYLSELIKTTLDYNVNDLQPNTTVTFKKPDGYKSINSSGYK